MTAPIATERGADAPTPPRTPVFIGGCPRSGTTLLGAMLGVGPNLVTVPESLFKFELLARSAQGQITAQAVQDVLGSNRRFAMWRVPVPVPDADELDVTDVLDEVVDDFARRVDKPAATHWLDHTPGNIRHAHSLLDLYPDARIINLVRDGRGVAASVLPLDWGPNRMAEAAPWWATHVAMGLALAGARGPQRVRTVRYEDLVRDPAATLEGLCSFLDITYDEAMISRRDYEIDAYTVTRHQLVRDLPDPSRAEAWREELTTEQVEEFEYRTGELSSYLGYPVVTGPGARPPPRADRLASFLVDVARRGVVDRVRRRRSERAPW